MAADVTAAPIELYYWPTPNGWKVSIALEEMGLPYTLHPVNIGVGEQHDPAFRALSPNGRMPAIVDPDGPGGEPISIFESGAILLYLARKTGQFYGADERARVRAEEWLFWQMGGLGPMAGQTHHFRGYAPTLTPDARHTAYGAIRYTNEVHRLHGVMEARLKEADYLAGEYSIADMAAFPWVIPWKAQGQDLDSTPHLKAWFERIAARPAVQKGRAVGEDLRRDLSAADQAKARAVLFGQRARP